MPSADQSSFFTSFLFNSLVLLVLVGLALGNTVALLRAIITPPTGVVVTVTVLSWFWMLQMCVGVSFTENHASVGNSLIELAAAMPLVGTAVLWLHHWSVRRAARFRGTSAPPRKARADDGLG